MADLDKLHALGAVVDEIDAEGPPTPEQLEKEKEEAEEVTEAAAWAQLPLMIGSMLSMFAPELQAVYTEDACSTWGERMVPVAKKYGWNGPSNLPEIGLAITTAGLALPTIIVIRAKLAQMKEANEAAHNAAKARSMAGATVPSPVTDVGVGDGLGT
jgi:hypothetical protein